MSSNPIPRTTQKIFAGNAPTDELAVFGSMSSGNPQYTTNVETLTNSNAYSQGFQDAVVNGEAPFLEETNGLFYAITSQLAYLFEKGVPEWDEGTTYYTNSFCQYQGIAYISTVDNNIGLAPNENPSQWTNYVSSMVDTEIGGLLAGKANTDLSNIENVNPNAKSLVTSWIIPDYSSGIQWAENAPAPSNGWGYMYSQGQYNSIQMYNSEGQAYIWQVTTLYGGQANSTMFLVNKGDYYKHPYSGQRGELIFYPFQGSSQ